MFNSVRLSSYIDFDVTGRSFKYSSSMTVSKPSYIRLLIFKFHYFPLFSHLSFPSSFSSFKNSVCFDFCVRRYCNCESSVSFLSYSIFACFEFSFSFNIKKRKFFRQGLSPSFLCRYKTKEH